MTSWLRRLAGELIGRKDTGDAETDKRADERLQGMLSWSCHVCGDRRPDDKISVHKMNSGLRGIDFTINVRYCNDREQCRRDAPSEGLRMVGQ